MIPLRRKDLTMLFFSFLRQGFQTFAAKRPRSKTLKFKRDPCPTLLRLITIESLRNLKFDTIHNIIFTPWKGYLSPDRRNSVRSRRVFSHPFPCEQAKERACGEQKLERSGRGIRTRSQFRSLRAHFWTETPAKPRLLSQSVE